ncbi:ADM [Rhinatrema bivittatum]|uniref:ADM n=1 Tax=Rhinatrema bivittatum TaxID=194408 RepID=UPI00112D8B39|nr:ADM [Rhinatrema bivittatum]
MKLVPVTLLYLSSVTFLGANAVRLDLASELKTKKWSARALGRVRREVRTPSKANAGVHASARSSFVSIEDAKDPLSPRSSSPGAHLRVRRQPPSPENVVKVGCRLGTCTLQNLAHQLHQYNDKDKDSTAPAKKMGSKGYGRRRRSLPARRLLFRVTRGKLRPLWLPGGSWTAVKRQERQRRNAVAPSPRAQPVPAFLRT